MKALKFTKLVLPKSEIEKLNEQEKKRYIMFAFILRDLNLLQKCLIFTGNENPIDKPSASAKTTISFFFMKTLASKIHEMWKFLTNNKLPGSSQNLSAELKERYSDIENFFSDKKVSDIFNFIRNKFGFHYEYMDDIDVLIDGAFKQFTEFEIWCSDDSANEIFSTTDAVALVVIFSEMKRLGFAGDDPSLMKELFELVIRGAKLFREFGVIYVAEAFPVNWEKRDEVVIQAPQYLEVKLPLIVSK